MAHGLRPLLAVSLIGITFAMSYAEAALANDAGNAKLACSLCDSLAHEMAGDPHQPFILRSFEPANGGSALHPALENTGFTYDNAWC